MEGPEKGDGWGEYKLYVMKSLARNEKDHDEIMGCLSDLKKDVAGLKVKAGMWGAVAGALAAAVPILISVMLSA